MSQVEGAQFEIWTLAVEAEFAREYCLTVADAGLSVEDLALRFDEGVAPRQFVAWFGKKYDLTTRQAFVSYR